jgi:hypothetical protein
MERAFLPGGIGIKSLIFNLYSARTFSNQGFSNGIDV